MGRPASGRYLIECNDHRSAAAGFPGVIKLNRRFIPAAARLILPLTRALLALVASIYLDCQEKSNFSWKMFS
jgi:hypothetical protein